MPELSEEPDLVRIHALFSQRDLDRLDRATGHVVFMASASGGMEIEEVAILGLLARIEKEKNKTIKIEKENNKTTDFLTAP